MIPAAVCLNCWGEDPKPEGLCAKCESEIEKTFEREVIPDEPGPGRIHYGMWVPDSTNYPDAA